MLREICSSAPPTFTTPDAAWMRFEHEATLVRIDERMALAPVDLLPGIIAARPTVLGAPDITPEYFPIPDAGDR